MIIFFLVLLQFWRFFCVILDPPSYCHTPSATPAQSPFPLGHTSSPKVPLSSFKPPGHSIHPKTRLRLTYTSCFVAAKNRKIKFFQLIQLQTTTDDYYRLLLQTIIMIIKISKSSLYLKDRRVAAATAVVVLEVQRNIWIQFILSNTDINVTTKFW